MSASFNQEKEDPEKEEAGIRNARRIAIVAGVNEYQEKDEIPTLAGAENDAKELRKILTTNNNFKVLDNHFLIGEHATRTAILRAISDVFRNATEAELVLFYFSGHGVVDEKSEGYIAPYDMYAKDPFVSGIRMEDLRQAIERAGGKTSVSVATILDCCYAGIVAKGTKALPSGNKKHLESVYEQKVRKLDEPGAKYVLASSEPDATSREMNECVHAYNSNPHPHGAFSFHLLEGLAGAAADETGIVTFRSLKDHIGRKMVEEGKQLPIFTQTETGAFGEISLGVRQNVFREYVSELVNDTRKLIVKEEETPLVDIRKLDDAVKILWDLSKKDPNNSELPKLKIEINQRFEEHRYALLEWLANNQWFAGMMIDKISPRLYKKFEDVAYELSYEGYQKLKEEDKRFLVRLSYEFEARTEYKSVQDEGLRKLVGTLEAIKRRYDLNPHSGAR